MTKRRLIRIYPDSERPGWQLFVKDETEQPVTFAGSYDFRVTVETARSVYPISGTMTQPADEATLDRDLDDDVPSLVFEPAASAFAGLVGQRSRAVAHVYIGTGGVWEREDFPARVIP